VRWLIRDTKGFLELDERGGCRAEDLLIQWVSEPLDRASSATLRNPVSDLKSFPELPQVALNCYLTVDGLAMVLFLRKVSLTTVAY